MVESQTKIIALVELSILDRNCFLNLASFIKHTHFMQTMLNNREQDSVSSYTMAFHK